MSQPKGKTNFRTYEASTRLLAAVIATTGVKLDYAKIAQHVGGGVGMDAINHRFRPIKKLAKMQAICVRNGGDPAELPVDKAVAEHFGGGATAFGLQHRLRPTIQLAKMQIAYRNEKKDPGELPVEKGEIQKLFGESTPKGIEWQFRDIKNIGKAQQEAVQKGENPATVMTPGTPSAGRGRGSVAASTPGSGATARTPGTGASTGRGRKRKVPATLPPVESSDENAAADDNDSDFGIIETPSKPPPKRPATASAKKANGSATTPFGTPSNGTNGTPASVSTPALTSTPNTHTSIFGNGGGPAVTQPGMPSDDFVMSGGRSAEFHSWTPGRAPRQPIVKTEPVISANSFLSSVNTSGYGEEYFEDGEI